MVEITYQMVMSTLQTAGILVGIFYYIMTLRNQRKNQELTLKAQE
jgi:preprotein translocase subunit YajC